MIFIVSLISLKRTINTVETIESEIGISKESAVFEFIERQESNVDYMITMNFFDKEPWKLQFLFRHYRLRLQVAILKNSSDSWKTTSPLWRIWSLLKQL